MSDAPNYSRDLSTDSPGRQSEARKFAEFSAEHPEVWRLFVRFALEAIASGLRHYSADAVFHRLRWYTAVETRDAEEYKLNNNLTACFARRWAQEFPQHADFFRTRKSRFDGSEAA